MDRVGTDIVSVGRITTLLDRSGSAFLDRWFTPAEITYCRSKAVPSRHLAARFAAKEAVLKALPTRWRGPLPWRSIEVVLDDHGAPGIRLSGGIAAAAAEAGIRDVEVSLSHCDEYATATALVNLDTVP